MAILVMGIPLSGFGAQSNNNDVGTVASPFLADNPSVRLTSLGGDQVAAHGYFETLFSNPAGISTLSIPEIWISHKDSFVETRTNSLGIAFPFRKQSLGFSVQYFDRGEEERVGVDELGNHVLGLGEFNFSTTLLQAVWARSFRKKYLFGIGFKGWNDNFDGTSENHWAGDVGFIARSLLSFVDVGLAAKNIGPTINGFDLPTSYQGGVALNWKLKARYLDRASLFSEIDGASYRDAVSRTGIEVKQKYFSLRSGYENQTKEVDDSLGNFTFGLGVRLRGWQIDYAMVPKGDLGDQHRVALTVGLGLTPEEKERAARELDLAMESRIRARVSQHLSRAKQASFHGEWTLAVNEYSKVLDWDPKNRQAKRSLEVARQKQKIQRAEQTFREGQKLFQQKQWLDAASYFQQTLKIVPGHQKAELLLKKSKWQMDRSRKTVRKKQNQADISFNKGVRHYMDGHYSAALEEWKIVADVSPKRPLLREYIEKAKKMKLKAELDLVRGQKVKDAQSIEALSKRAYTLYSLNRFDEAIYTWESVLGLDPKNKDAAAALKEARAKKELYRDGKNAPKPRRVEELNSEAMSAYINGQLGEAATIWRKALLVDPANTRVRGNLERVEKELRDQEAAQ